LLQASQEKKLQEGLGKGWDGMVKERETGGLGERY